MELTIINNNIIFMPNELVKITSLTTPYEDDVELFIYLFIYLFFFVPFLNEFIGVTLLNKTIEVLSVQFYNT